MQPLLRLLNPLTCAILFSTHACSLKRSMAAAAHEFGQNDDITVLSITMVAEKVLRSRLVLSDCG